jgi:hypothetical protein
MSVSAASHRRQFHTRRQVQTLGERKCWRGAGVPRTAGEPLCHGAPHLLKALRQGLHAAATRRRPCLVSNAICLCRRHPAGIGPVRLRARLPEQLRRLPSAVASNSGRHRLWRERRCARQSHQIWRRAHKCALGERGRDGVGRPVAAPQLVVVRHAARAGWFLRLETACGHADATPSA